MKKTVLSFMGLLFAITCMAQTDSVQVQRKSDTIRIGGMIILKKGDPDDKRVTVTVGNRNYNKKANINTASFVIDLGFANWADKTNYTTATSGNYLVNQPGSAALAENDFRLRTIKSVNVNIWFFMQRLNLIKHFVNLKYGLGLELNNYRFKSDVSLKEAGANPYNLVQDINHPFIFRDSISFSKNKLAADYVTVPMMLNFRTNPNSSDKGLSFSAGVSVGYLYSSRNKQKSSERGKERNRGDYNLETWKFSYIGEIGLGPVHLYGSYSPNSIFEKGLSFMPYTVGIRLCNW
jgi:Outer membrane protein beta-barrel domain